MLFFIVLVVIMNIAGEQSRGHRQEQEEIIGWRLEAEGDALESSGVGGG